MKLFFQTIKINKFYNLILIVQMAFLLFIVTIETRNLINQYDLENYITTGNDMYYMSVKDTIMDEGIVSGEEMEAFCRHIERAYDVNIGYELFTYANIDNRQVYLVYANEAMCKIQYMLDSGRWFDNSGESQVILGHEYKGRYKVGDKVLLSQSDENKIYADVVGFFQSHNNIIQLNTGGDGINYDEILTNMNSVNDCFAYTNATDVKEWSGLKSFSNALIVQGGKAEIEKVSKYGVINSFEEIKENSKDSAWKAYRTSGVYLLLILLLFFNSILLLSVISYKNSINMYTNFFMCGMRRLKIFVFLMINMVINCMCTMIMDLVVISLTQIREQNDLNADIKVVAIYLLAVMIVHFIYCIIMMSRIKHQCIGRKLEYEN